PDDGLFDGLNKGFQHTTGEVMGWLNSDDQLMPWSLSIVGELMATFSQIEWLTTLYQLVLDRHGRVVRCMERKGYSRAAFLLGENLQETGVRSPQGWIQQESTFWRRPLWLKAVGRLSSDYPLALDFELWARFFHHAKLYGVVTPLGAFRQHGNQRSVLGSQKYVD